MKLFALTSLLAAIAVVAAAPSAENNVKRSDEVEARCMGSGCSNQGW